MEMKRRTHISGQPKRWFPDLIVHNKQRLTRNLIEERSQSNPSHPLLAFVFFGSLLFDGSGDRYGHQAHVPKFKMKVRCRYSGH